MNERFIYLAERYFDKEISEDENNELQSLLNSDDGLMQEFNEQKRIKEVLNKMKLKNPSKEFWDGYWESIYNKIERNIAWIFISIGAILILSYASIEAVENFLADTEMPSIVKYGIAGLFIGGVILFVSVIREKIFSMKKDKYKDIVR